MIWKQIRRCKRLTKTSATFTEVTQRLLGKLTTGCQRMSQRIPRHALETRNSPKSILLKVKYYFC